jgi:malate:Na+ symporter
MLAIAVVLKLARAVSPSLQLGAFHVYKFFSTAVTYPLLFAIGVSLMPWDKVVAAFTVPYLITIVSTRPCLKNSCPQCRRKRTSPNRRE